MKHFFNVLAGYQHVIFFFSLKVKVHKIRRWFLKNKCALFYYVLFFCVGINDIKTYFFQVITNNICKLFKSKISTKIRKEKMGILFQNGSHCIKNSISRNMNLHEKKKISVKFLFLHLILFWVLFQTYSFLIRIKIYKLFRYVILWDFA